jgi:uncharacterized protein
MKQRRARWFLALSLLMSACGRSPNPTFFALSPQPGGQLQSMPLKVELRRLGLPGYLDRPHIVSRATAERLELDADERWGAPLDEMVSATLAENLAQRLPTSAVFSDAGAISTPADVRVEVQLTRFERTAQGAVTLAAEVAVHSTRPGAPGAAVQRFTLSEEPAGSETADVVTSLSRLLGKLADGIAPLIVRQAP